MEGVERPLLAGGTHQQQNKHTGGKQDGQVGRAFALGQSRIENLHILVGVVLFEMMSVVMRGAVGQVDAGRRFLAIETQMQMDPAQPCHQHGEDQDQEPGSRAQSQAAHGAEYRKRTADLYTG